MKNMYEEIVNGIEGKNFDNFTKVRWIYLYICKNFSYDSRYYYANEEQKDTIYNKKINLSSVDEFEIVCYTAVRALQDALSIFGFKSEIIKEKPIKRSHVKLLVEYEKGKYLSLDPTISHDTTRVKMKSHTYDFIERNNPIFDEKLDEADKIINYYDKEIDYDVYYNSKSIDKLYRVMTASLEERGASATEVFLEKLEYVFSLLDMRNDFTRFDDIDYYFSYLIYKFNLNDKGISYIKPALFINREDKNDLVDVVLIDYPGLSPMFYLLSKDKDKQNYTVKGLSKELLINILENYYSICTDLFFRYAQNMTELINKDRIIR